MRSSQSRRRWLKMLSTSLVLSSLVFAAPVLANEPDATAPAIEAEAELPDDVLAIVEAPIAAAPEAITIFIDGEALELSADSGAAEITNDRTFVPLRVISENMGLIVDFDAETQSIVVSVKAEATIDEETGLPVESDEVTVIFNHTVGETFVTMADGTTSDIGVASYIKDDRTMVALRLFSEALGLQVNWDGEARSVSIVTAETSEPEPTDPEDPTTPEEPTEPTLGLSIAEADEALLASFPSVTEEPIVIDEEGSAIALYTEEALSNVRLVAVEYLPIEEDSEEHAFVEGEVIHQLDEMAAMSSLVIQHNVPEIIPQLMVSYVDSQETEQAFLISWSGETGDIILIAYEQEEVTTPPSDIEEEPNEVEEQPVNPTEGEEQPTLSISYDLPEDAGKYTILEETLIVTEGAEVFYLYADQDLSDFAIIPVTFLEPENGEEGMEPVYSEAEEALLSLDKFAANTALKIQSIIPEGPANLMVRYNDAEGNEYAFFITYNGRDGSADFTHVLQ